MTSRTVFYVKRGRRYIPVREYDRELIDSMHYGTHLVEVTRSGGSRKYGVKPEHAPLIAAAQDSIEELTKALVRFSDLRPSKTPITPEQKQAWENLSAAFGDDMHLLQWPSMMEVTDLFLKHLIARAEEKLINPSVKEAYEKFLLVSKLSE
jgi:hypothetical protein